MWHLFALIAAIVLNASANLFLKFGMSAISASKGVEVSSGIGSAMKAMCSTPYIFLGLFFFGLNVPLYAFALGKFKVSLAYPIMTGCGFAIIVVIAGMSGLQERLNPIQWCGIVLILLGVTLVSSQLQS